MSPKYRVIAHLVDFEGNGVHVLHDTISVYRVLTICQAQADKLFGPLEIGDEIGLFAEGPGVRLDHEEGGIRIEGEWIHVSPSLEAEIRCWNGRYARRINQKGRYAQ